MTIPRISGLLIMLACGHDALALQMGQISSESVRGQPLLARVTLYGRPAASDAELRAELLPMFGAAPDSLVALGLSARVETDELGAQTIVITSSQNFDAATLALRVRLKEGAGAILRHYELTIPAAPLPRAMQPARQGGTAPARRGSRAARDRAPNNPALATSMDAGADYGPVRAGQSLWSILQENGLAAGDTQNLMRDIVAANPQAFVNGDATRLRVGVSLRLPMRARTASAAPAREAGTAARASAETIDAATSARIERLGVKFAEIRARYAAQKQQEAAVVAAASKVAPQGAVVAARSFAPQESAPVVTPLAKSIKQVQATPRAVAQPPREESGGALDTLAKYVDGKLLMMLGASLLLAALLLVGVRFGRRLRTRMADAGVRSADQELVAEIARKTEKRAQLEGEVKRMIAGRRDAVEEAAPGMLRPADLLGGPRASLEDIETRIAHGQYNEAESMLEATIADAPNNHRAKLRLAEIYYLNERHEEFVDLADEIHRQHRSDIGDENWSRLMRMGKVIAPDRPPFSGPVAVEAGRRAR